MIADEPPIPDQCVRYQQITLLNIYKRLSVYNALVDKFTIFC